MLVHSTYTQSSKSYFESRFLPFLCTASFTGWCMKGAEPKVGTSHPLQAQLT